MQARALSARELSAAPTLLNTSRSSSSSRSSMCPEMSAGTACPLMTRNFSAQTEAERQKSTARPQRHAALPLGAVKIRVPRANHITAQIAVILLQIQKTHCYSMSQNQVVNPKRYHKNVRTVSFYFISPYSTRQLH